MKYSQVRGGHCNNVFRWIDSRFVGMATHTCGQYLLDLIDLDFVQYKEVI